MAYKCTEAISELDAEIKYLKNDPISNNDIKTISFLESKMASLNTELRMDSLFYCGYINEAKMLAQSNNITVGKSIESYISLLNKFKAADMAECLKDYGIDSYNKAKKATERLCYATLDKFKGFNIENTNSLLFSGITPEEFDYLSKQSFFEKENWIGGCLNNLSQKASPTENDKQIYEKLNKLVDFLKIHSIVSNKLEQSNLPGIEQYRNKLFDLTKELATQKLSQLKGQHGYNDLFQIMKKFNIENPLDLSKVDGSKFSVAEKHKFNLLTHDLSRWCAMDLSLEKANQYFDIYKEQFEYFSFTISEYIKELHPEFKVQAENYQKELFAYKFEPNILNNITKNISSSFDKYLVEKYSHARQESEYSKNTTETDKAKSNIVSRTKELYNEAFNGDGNIIKKKELDDLLYAAGKLEIVDEDIRYYSGLSSDYITAEQRKELIKLHSITASGNEISITDKEHLLTSYKAFLSKYLEKEPEENRRASESLEGTWHTLYYAIQSSGIPEQELLDIGGDLGYANLSPRMKALINKETPLETIISETVKCNTEYAKGNSSVETRKDWECLRWMVYAKKGRTEGWRSIISAYGQGFFYSNNTILGNTFAELTPERFDDYQYINFFRKAIKLAPGVINHWDLISGHISSRKFTSSQADENFIDEILKSSPTRFSLPGHSSNPIMNDYKQRFLDLMMAKHDEHSFKIKPIYTKTKNDMLSWLKETYIDAIRNNITKDPAYAGSSEMSNKLNYLALFSSNLIETDLITEDEWAAFSNENPVIPSCKLDSIKTLATKSSNEVFRTIGYNNIPKEIKSLIKAGGLEEVFLQNNDKLNIYWVPFNNTSFAGYAPTDKNSIVITYDPKNPNRVFMAEICVHELSHKLDMFALNNYLKLNPNEISTLPSLLNSMITERNAYISSTLFISSIINNASALKLNAEEIAFCTNRLELENDIINRANLLLGANNSTLSSPPYTEIFEKAIYYEKINPAKILEYETLKKLIDKIQEFGYNEQETNSIMLNIINITPGNPAIFGIGPNTNNNLLLNFLSKCLAFISGKEIPASTDEITNSVIIMKDISKNNAALLLKNEGLSDEKKQALALSYYDNGSVSFCITKEYIDWIVSKLTD